ncbi:MAG TPA: hypothetical protein IAA05_16090, partial [Candidatus Blautia excrementipullorum]|nr:hypothetical protein [Candidatus Blautia excrementipullorum]
ECCTKALTEIQQYREMDRKLRLLTNEDADMWDAYRAVGTVEECQEAVEKQKPQKALIETIYGYGEKKYRCPECGETLMGVDIFAGYCKWCGQAIIN